MKSQCRSQSVYLPEISFTYNSLDKQVTKKQGFKDIYRSVQIEPLQQMKSARQFIYKGSYRGNAYVQKRRSSIQNSDLVTSFDAPSPQNAAFVTQYKLNHMQPAHQLVKQTKQEPQLVVKDDEHQERLNYIETLKKNTKRYNTYSRTSELLMLKWLRLRNGNPDIVTEEMIKNDQFNEKNSHFQSQSQFK